MIKMTTNLTTLFDLLAQGEIKPVIAECLPLAKAAQAHGLLGTSSVTGKIVLVCNA